MIHVAQRATGKIAVVQEERFRLMTDEGQGLLLTLSHRAKVTPEELHRHHREGARVVVEYEGEANLATGVAKSVQRA